MLKSMLLLVLVLPYVSFLPAGNGAENDKPGNTPPVFSGVAFVGSNIRFVKDSVKAFVTSVDWQVAAWKGEKVHTQILISTEKDLANCSVIASPLKDKKGTIIPVKTGFVRYVLTDEFGDGCGGRKPGDFDSSYAADPIDTASSGPVEKGLQPVWLSLTVFFISRHRY